MKQRILRTTLLTLGITAIAVINGCLPTPDYEPPVVTILNPAPAEVVQASQQVPIVVVASDDFELKQIVIMIEGREVLDTGENPARFNWVVNANDAGADGQVHISAYGVDEEDHIGPAQVVATTLQTAPGAPAVEPPTAEIISPENGTTINRNDNYRIEVDAFDNNSIERVEFYANGQLIGEDTELPYELNWDVMSMGVTGRTNIFVKAYDNEGQTAAHVTAVHIK
ncbi:MAG: Ig-like domain-containing protein [Calditrichota bacterium]